MCFQVAKKRTLGATKREKGHRRRDADVHTDHADADTISEFARGFPALREDRRRIGEARPLHDVDPSSRLLTCVTEATGPKISSLPIVMSGCTPSKTVGPTKWPRGCFSTLVDRPSSSSVAPSLRPASTYDSTRSLCRAETTG